MKGYDRAPSRKDTDVVGERIGASIVDGLLSTVLMFGMLMLWIAVAAAGSDGLATLGMVLAWFSSIGYFCALEAVWDGQTVGKKLFGIKVVRADGSQCGIKASVVRNLLRMVDGLFYYLVGILFISSSDRRQRLGDRVANTVVVDESPATGRRRAVHDQRARHPEDPHDAGRYDRGRSPGHYDEGRRRSRHDEGETRGRHDQGESPGRYDEGRYEEGRPRSRHDEGGSRGRYDEGRARGGPGTSDDGDRHGDGRSRDQFSGGDRYAEEGSGYADPDAEGPEYADSDAGEGPEYADPDADEEATDTEDRY